jgi:diguanylate cyclase (GGDEF)-like protein
MLRVSRAAVSISDPALLLRDIAESALEMDDVDGCEIERYDPENGLVHNDTIAFAGPWRYQYNPTISHQLVDIPTFANAIHRDGATTYLMSDPHVTPYERDAFRAIGIESVLVIPLTYEGETLGVLTLLRCQPVRFAARTEALANELATHASLALGRARLFETLRSRADSDGVTGLANHRAILERIDTGLQQIESTNGSLSLLLIDLDRFKQLNDARGHLTGDRYLREVANLIRDSIGERGIAARYGGDEFLVLLHDCDVEECSAIADELIETCRNATFTLDGETVSCGFSVGTATAPLHGRTRDALIGHADRGMYDAKQHGGGRIGHTK